MQLCGVNEELLTRHNAPAHYQNAITDDRALVLSLIEAVETKGYFPVLPKRMWTALGRGKKGDVFDPALGEEIKAVRDKMKAAVQKALDILPQGEEKLELWLHLENLSLPARRGLAMLCEEVDRLYSAAKEKKAASPENSALLGRESLRSISGSTLPSTPAAAMATRFSWATTSAASVKVASSPLVNVPTPMCVGKLAMLALPLVQGAAAGICPLAALTA